MIAGIVLEFAQLIRDDTAVTLDGKRITIDQLPLGSAVADLCISDGRVFWIDFQSPSVLKENTVSEVTQDDHVDVVSDRTSD